VLPSIIQIRAVTLYAICTCDAVEAITILVRAIQLMDDLPYSEYHDEYMMKQAVLEYLKFIAVEDMKIKGKLN
jgi:hypothetical protein